MNTLNVLGKSLIYICITRTREVLEWIFDVKTDHKSLGKKLSYDH